MAARPSLKSLNRTQRTEEITMPAKRKKEKILGQYFSWLLGQRKGIYLADGRSNPVNVGRHSLGTRNREEALRLLVRLDAVKAVETGKGPATILQNGEQDSIT